MSFEQVTSKLNEIEAELRKLGYLKGPIGGPASAHSAFGHKEMSFEQWLTSVFLPNARQAITAHVLPTNSQVGIAAIRNFDGYDEADTLVSLLCEFDQVVENTASGAGASM